MSTGIEKKNWVHNSNSEELKKKIVLEGNEQKVGNQWDEKKIQTI